MTSKANVGRESIKTAIKPFRSDSEGLFPLPLCLYALRLACACRAFYGRLQGFCPSALPVCLAQRVFLSRLALCYGNMTTFTSGVNIHTIIHFTMVTRQHDSMVNLSAWWVDSRQQHCFARASITGRSFFATIYLST